MKNVIILKQGQQDNRFSAKNDHQLTSLSNSIWQNRKERPNRSTNNCNIAETAKRPVRE